MIGASIFSVSVLLSIALASAAGEQKHPIGHFIVQSFHTRQALVNKASGLECAEATKLYHRLAEMLTQATNRSCDDLILLRAKQAIRSYVFRVWQIALDADEAHENALHQGEGNIAPSALDGDLHQTLRSKYASVWRSENLNCKNLDGFVDNLEASAIDLLRQAINAWRLDDKQLLKRSLQLLHKLIFDLLGSAQKERVNILNKSSGTDFAISVKAAICSVDQTFKYIHKTIATCFHNIQTLGRQFLRNISNILHTKLNRLPFAAITLKIQILGHEFRTKSWLNVDRTWLVIDEKIAEAQHNFEAALMHRPKLKEVEEALLEMNSLTINWTKRTEDAFLKGDAVAWPILDKYLHKLEAVAYNATAVDELLRRFDVAYGNFIKGIQSGIWRDFQATDRRLRQVSQLLLQAGHEAESWP